MTDTLKLVKTKRLKDAYGVYCPQCDQLIADICEPYWSIDKSKWLHENGTGHKPFYVGTGPA